ncbi:putative protein tag-53 [Orchesella cincta]|uniref:Attractin n=1 Tax=Orchesella cincta TaxID=48709 RepID=A0A1D2N862_ORCCI|nr:putative protein tag-53 [Orchesella cincta]
MIGLQKFLFLFISKYRRKLGLVLVSCVRNLYSNGKSRLAFISVLYYVFGLGLILRFDEANSLECGVISTSANDSNSSATNASVSEFVSNCLNGDCVNGVCVCRKGWYGPSCQYCYGKVRVQGNKGWISEGPGNYTNNMKCSWLIESPTTESTSPSPIIIHIEEFATECGWDHLYIYDGDNAHAPLLGVFSGLLVQKNYSVLRLPEVVAKSGFAFLHFYTDVVYNLTGFNITYRTNSCPSLRSNLTCSGNGVCIDGVCTCNARYKGDACEIQKCPNNCTNDTNQGTCNMEQHKCDCINGYRGNDCSQIERRGFWEVVTPTSEVPLGSASHCSVLVNDYLWVFGGSRLNLEPKESVLQRYDFTENTWETIRPKGESSPPALYGHSCVVFENKVYLYGGVYDGKFGNRDISKSLWVFDINSKTWSEASVKPSQCKKRMCGPLHLSGHSAVVINEKGGKNRHNKMVVISGHSPRYGYVNVIQEYHFGSGTWNVIPTKGYPVGGSYGHSSSWDPITQKIYVYGGYRIDYDSVHMSDKLFTYDPLYRTWKMMESSPGGRFLHTSLIYKGLMYIFGGCAHNDTTYSMGSKCFTEEVLIYDVKCDLWSSMIPAVPIPADIARYGLSSVIYNESVYLYGGFNGIIQSDLIRYRPPACGSFLDPKDCQSSVSVGTKCVWNKTQKTCEEYVTLVKEKEKQKELDKEKAISFPADTCQNGKYDGKMKCAQFMSCSSCVHNKFGCVWCGGQCQYAECLDPRHKASDSEQCPTECSALLHTCPLCVSEVNCIWGKKCSKGEIAVRNTTDRVSDVDQATCDQSCADYTSCSNCTSNRCIWCNNLNTCVDKNAYVISFPFGQCMSWTEDTKMCYNKDPHSVAASVCDEVATCDTCLSLPSCGWCDDGSGTGLGRCMDGSSRGPLVVDSSSITVNWTMCPSKEWHFTDCPDCQCNGHSTCDENNKCLKCEGNTQGNQCKRCSSGFYGNALNGGQCKTCECNGQADTCHTETGKCFCTTKGVTGEDCGRCDTQSNYAGDPINGSCFYDLQIDYQFTFNLSKEGDRHYTRINFRNSPTKPDIDADFQITCSILAKMNISFSSGGFPEKTLYHGMNCTTFRYRFAKNDYNFGGPDNTTVYVYVYDFQPPLWIQISFSQSPKLDLLHFFITFSTCFLLLLLIAAILWKVKQKYDMYRRRQRLFVEMEQMASRPFAQVYVEMGRGPGISRLPAARKRRKQWPSPIALEPCQGNRAAVLSLLVTLPNGGQPFAPAGQSGISLGSALVALGNPRKVSFEPITKTDGKNSKLRKSLPSHSLSTCI